MAYQKGDIIRAEDYNNFVGSPTLKGQEGEDTNNKATIAFDNDVDTTEKVAALYGRGYGDRGYGQLLDSNIPIILPNKSPDDLVLGTDWLNLRNSIDKIADHQGTEKILLPPAENFEPGQPIIAHEQDDPSFNSYDFQDMIALIDSNRHNFISRNFTDDDNIEQTLLQSLRYSSSWNHNQTLTGTFRFGIIENTNQLIGNTDSWTDQEKLTAADQIRYFFNTGGHLRISLSYGIIPGGGLDELPDDIALRSFFNDKYINMFARHINTSNDLSDSIDGNSINTGYYNIPPYTTTIPLYETLINHVETVDLSSFDGVGEDVSMYRFQLIIHTRVRDVIQYTTNGSNGLVIELIVHLSNLTGSTVTPRDRRINVHLSKRTPRNILNNTDMRLGSIIWDEFETHD